MIKAAIYARYSCNQQRETSIDDQIRRCRELAQRYGFTVDENQIFSDAALSGTEKHRERRDGYNALVKAWDAGEFNVLLADDQNRLSRDGVEQALIVRRLEQNQRVSLVTTNGIDTRIPNWQVSMGVMAVIGQQAIRDTQGLVTRGMVGQLVRGYMIATPAFGYVLDRQFDAQGERIGTHWKIDEKSAEIVRSIFQKRGAGQSMRQIACWLNELGLPLRRKARCSDGGYWRPSRVNGILRNPIYRGEFLWNASTTVRARAKKCGRKLEVVAYPRPQLRLVSDELWYRCNTNIISRSGYGGGKHPFSGLVTCGHCASVLTLTSKSRCRSLYCTSCANAKSMGVDATRQTSTIAVAGVEKLLRTALSSFLTKPFIELFRAKLQERLTGGHKRDIEDLEKELAQCKRAQERISHLLGNSDVDDDVLITRYEESREKVRSVSSRLQVLRDSVGQLDQNAIKEQMQVDPKILLDSLFEQDIPAEQLRALLTRLFPQIVFEGKPHGRYTSIFGIEFDVGQAMAMASNTEVTLGDQKAYRRYQLSYHPNALKKNPEWTVVELTDEVNVDETQPAIENSCPPVLATSQEMGCCMA